MLLFFSSFFPFNFCWIEGVICDRLKLKIEIRNKLLLINESGFLFWNILCWFENVWYVFSCVGWPVIKVCVTKANTTHTCVYYFHQSNSRISFKFNWNLFDGRSHFSNWAFVSIDVFLFLSFPFALFCFVCFYFLFSISSQIDTLNACVLCVCVYCVCVYSKNQDHIYFLSSSFSSNSMVCFVSRIILQKFWLING